MRTLSKDLHQHIGQTVTVQGWLHKKRLLGGLTFINVRDRSGVVQVVLKDKDEVEKLRGMQIGTVLEVVATVKDEPRAPGGVELHDANLTVMVPVTAEPPVEIDKPLSHKADNLDTLFDHRVFGLRNVQETAIFKIRADLTRYIREFLHQQDFTEIHTPKLVAGAAEGGAEVFKLDYFGQEATLAQSPQLYKQIMVGVFERVFEIAPAFRAELSATTRHVSEVTMLDIEMGFIQSHDDVTNMVQDLVYNVVTRVYQEHGEALKKLGAPELKLTEKFPCYSQTEVHQMFTKATGKDTTKEIDLTPEEEKWICEYTRKNDGSDAVFITEMPVLEKMKFYHKKAASGTHAEAADLLFRGVELATVPQREHRYEELVEQIKAAGIDPESPGFSHFLTAMKHGLPPHGGCGFGIDRLTQKVIGLANVKEAILFPRDINRLAP